ncbi:MAG: hypothetical protein QOI94_2392, partial [Acidobacteriaceae bacterium]|nr:hypothetical protein [Acidobacteriaceae bacterium]
MRENRTCSLSGGRRPAPASVGAPPPTRLEVKGSDKYLYRAVDSTGQTIDFLLTAKRDAAAAKRFLRNAIEASGNAMPRVMNVDKNPAYPAAVEALKADGMISRRVELRQCKYLNNMIEQDH